MAARRMEILEAAKRCFAHKGFAATTIADLAREASVSAGGIYVHFSSKHEIAAAIGGRATEEAGDSGPIDPMALYDHLISNAGHIDAQLDLNLWSASLHDAELHEMVTGSMDRAKKSFRDCLPKAKQSKAYLALVEAVVLGLEVQRALSREQPVSLRSQVAKLLEESDA